MKSYIFALALVIPLSVFTQNNEFRYYSGNKNKFTSTIKSNTAYNKGLDYFEIGDYSNAISQFTITINEDEKQKYLSTDL